METAWPPAGWALFDVRGTGTWAEQWEPIAYQSVGSDRITFRLVLRPGHGNRLGGVHGGFLAGLGEHCLGMLAEARTPRLDTVTISVAFDYPSGAVTTLPLDGEVELLRETGRMMFVRLLIRQEERVVLSGSGTLRKL